MTNRWLTHAGHTPRAIEEPADGIVELIGATFHARIRIDASPLTQGAVLAHIRSVKDPSDVKLLLFSATGFTTGAMTFGDGQGIALFDLTEDGDVVPRNTHARVVMPAEELAPAFTVPLVEDDSVADEEDDEAALQTPETINWRDCPRCGATHHPRANFCGACGADLNSKIAVIGSSGGGLASKLDNRGASHPSSGAPQTSGQPVPAPRANGPTLRCRTCGSHDIELVEPE